ncbi:janus kinase and microtubule-interacting protein 3-like [Diprion similis]|uniref:janus kinase and microtubule-interacting protein 3-like n=1 Tax=Diprion similis TaxID=362088 RepID=UPI001EF78B39|nr:janus kinase and microtubule-interacting protein 3-like [Diprion similis]XP_046750034.1 janus kinase and microtubule-interacting protein 3-like [Diprion similis]XP_046750035.1 janus kinase and microtubule-interacting protein 3-like [Diprion similis]
MTTNPSAGDTVIPTKTSITTNATGDRLIPGKTECHLARAESTPAARKRHLDQSSSPTKGEIPTKSPRKSESPVEVVAKDLQDSLYEVKMCVASAEDQKRTPPCATESRPEVPRDKPSIRSLRKRENQAKTQSPAATAKPQLVSRSQIPCRSLKRPSSEEIPEGEKSHRKSRADGVSPQEPEVGTPQSEAAIAVPPQSRTQTHQQFQKRDEAVKLRKTIQWLEEGARRMREDLAATRAELHEERKAARLARRELDSAVKDAKNGEAARHLRVIAELKTRLAQSPTRTGVESTSTSSKADILREENHRRELSALRRRLAEAEASVQKLKANACSPHGSGKRRKVEGADGRRLEVEVQALRTANRKLEDRLQVVTEAEKKRATELRIQHENHEAQLAALQRTLRSDTIKMMDEIRSKTREVEKLERLVLESSQMHRKLRTKEDDLMRKLRETERSNQVRLAPRIEDKNSTSTEHVEDSCTGDCEAAAEVERLRELSVEQQEVIEILRQAVKEKERKLDQISNKKRKEEFYKQWLELEPVVEVEDEDEHEHEEGDSALSSAPSSLSPQPGGCGQWQQTGVTREAYETVLLEVEELQSRLVEEQRELAHAKSQVRDLEKALLQETRGSQNSRRALSDKLREIEDREATLVAEISELREQNELLEFRVLELEESPCLRDTPDPADSGIVSPEPIHLYKDQVGKQKDRAVATIIPYNTYNSPASPIPQKPPLSLQESGIFDEDDEADVELASRGTQTEAPAGDLLQEVQRLHELRARIQERAVKVPVPMIDPKLDVPDVADSGQNANSYLDRIRELEQRLAAHEEAESKRNQDKQLSKQREEELLDENYRLTERIYWFENLLRNSKNLEEDLKGSSNVQEDELTPKNDDSHVSEEHEDASSAGMQNPEATEVPQTILSTPGSVEAGKSMTLEDLDVGCNECGKMRSEVIGRLEELVQVELLTRQRIVDLERREATYMKTLQKADEMWVEAERGYSNQLKELRAKLELELSEKQKLSQHAAELKDKLNEIRTSDDVADRCTECVRCRRFVMPEIFISEADQSFDEVDAAAGSGESSGDSASKIDPKSKISSNITAAAISSVGDGSGEENLTSSKPLVNSIIEQDTARKVKVSKVFVPEIVAELAIEAKEEEAPSEESDNRIENTDGSIPDSAGKGKGVVGVVQEGPSGKNDIGIDVVEGGEAQPEPVVTINETEPKKKVIYFRWR